MSGLPWFRCYASIIDDEKIRLLAFEDRWHFVAILACKAQGILDTQDDDSILRRKVAVKLGLQVRELEEAARRLAEIDLICEDTLQPIAWDRRQYVSDFSTERVRQYRERQAKKRDETLQKRSAGVSVTPPDTDTESETDTDTEKKDDPNGSLSGKSPTSRISAADVDHVLDYLNARAGTAYKRVNGDGKESKNAKLVRQRIKEHGMGALLAVVDAKCDAWLCSDKMRPYLRPATLFGAEKCEQYVGEVRRSKPGSFLDDDVIDGRLA